jgi:glycosyltransferase involved in cell wall biosynthesis
MAEKIKILHVIKSLGRGGAEMLLPESLKLHDQTRFEFHYIYFLPWKNQMVEAIIQAGGHVTCLTSSNNLQLMLKAGIIIRYVRQHNIQLIHAHLPWAGFVGRVVHLLTKVPLLYTEHNKQERYHSITRWLNRFTFNWQTAAIAVSGDVAESIKKNIRPSVPVMTVLNGVNTEYFQRNKVAGESLRKQFQIPTDACVVGTVAVFRFQKRLKEWLEVFKLASDHDPNLYGIIVGDGPLRAELEVQRKALNLGSKVLMPGLQTEMKSWYSAFDVFMMTSVFEGLPVALLEAMSMECAVVTTDAGGIKEVIQPGKNGLMETVDDWLMLSNHVIALAANPANQQTLGHAAREQVIDSFGMKRMVRELEGLYDEKESMLVSSIGPL